MPSPTQKRKIVKKHPQKFTRFQAHNFKRMGGVSSGSVGWPRRKIDATTISAPPHTMATQQYRSTLATTVMVVLRKVITISPSDAPSVTWPAPTSGSTIATTTCATTPKVQQ